MYATEHLALLLKLYRRTSPIAGSRTSSTQIQLPQGAAGKYDFALFGSRRSALPAIEEVRLPAFEEVRLPAIEEVRLPATEEVRLLAIEEVRFP
jgi:hypothetical protein